MRFQGIIESWNDDKGFGFVEHNGSGQRAFVHIKAFKIRPRRPVTGDVITYELVREKDNRYRAEKIRFTDAAHSTSKGTNGKSNNYFGTTLTLIVCAWLLFSTVTGKLPLMVTGIYLVVSLITFIAYAIDKSAAKNGRWRTQENTLHTLALIGGWPGAFMAQNSLRHKSSKAEFKRAYWLTVLVNLGGLYWLHTEDGARFLRGVILPMLN
mgnify:CR=1 FL=1